MSSLDRLQAAGVPRQAQNFVRGTVVTSTNGTAYSVNVNGTLLPATALDHVAVANGDTVLVAVVISAAGQAEAFVFGRIGTGLHPATGTVATVPPSPTTITVTGDDGGSYTAYFPSSYTPAVGDIVNMTWLAGYAYASKVPATPPQNNPSTGVSAPPGGAATSGTTTFAASDSSTWSSPNGWGSWRGGSDVYEGDGGSGALTGAWFYGSGPTQLNDGRTISGGRVTVGPRLAEGNYTAALTGQLWTHSSATRPGGDVSLLNGPVSITVQPWQGLATYTLTQAMAQDLVNGGGLCITGGPYLGFQGVTGNAQSGAVSIDWSK